MTEHWTSRLQRLSEETGQPIVWDPDAVSALPDTRTVSGPRTTLERHLTEVHLEGCTCPHKWKGLGILYGISLGRGWVRMADAGDCLVHGSSVKP